MTHALRVTAIDDVERFRVGRRDAAQQGFVGAFATRIAALGNLHCAFLQGCPCCAQVTRPHGQRRDCNTQ